MRFSLLILALFSFQSALIAQDFMRQAKRVVFFGDSITHAGHYLTIIEAKLLQEGEGKAPELINLGLPSETCNGMSEPAHPFPRPDVHERFQRALDRLKPDVVVACYGMNDGIYYPPTPKHLDAYKKGIAGIIQKTKASGAKLVLMTPPAFDPLPLKKKGKLRPAGQEEYSWKNIYENYNEVLEEFSQHVMGRSDEVDLVINLFDPVNEYVANKRKTDPEFSMSHDGVHVNKEGHKVLAATIAKAFKINDQQEPNAELLKLVSQRRSIMHPAWVSEVGHLRPGVKAGLPINQAKQSTKEINAKIAEIFVPAR